MWAIVALASAICFAGVSIIDKHLLDRRFPNVSSLYVWIAWTLALYAVIPLAVNGIPWDAPRGKLLVAYLSGVSLGAGFALMFIGLKLEEASRAIAITQIYPVYVALLAVGFLNETLRPLQWLAIILVVMGVVLISFREGADGKLFRLGRGLPFLLATGVGEGLGYFALKYSLNDLSVWTVFPIQQLGLLSVFGLFVRPSTCREVFSLLRDRSLLILLIIGEGILPFIAIILGLWAANLGPISVVSAMLASRPLFVFVGSSILSTRRWNLMEESMAPGALAIKTAAIVMIVAGVSTLGLF